MDSRCAKHGVYETSNVKWTIKTQLDDCKLYIMNLQVYKSWDIVIMILSHAVILNSHSQHSHSMFILSHSTHTVNFMS